MNKIIELLHQGLGEMVIHFNNRFDWLLGKLNWNSTLYYGVLIAVGILLGLFAMRLVRPICGLLCGGIGFMAGYRLFAILTANVKFMANCPSFVKYILGAVVGLLLFFLGWYKCLHLTLVAYAGIGFYLASHYIAEGLWIGLAGALIAALLAACVIRFAFILLASAGSAYLLVYGIGKLLPNVKFLQITGGDLVLPCCICAVLAIVLALIQRETTRSYVCE